MAAAVFLLTFTWYVAGLAPSVYWLDSSELAAAAWTLGVAHPPGHGLAALIGRALALVPLGSIALKVGLASALAGAAAATQAARLGRLVAGRTRAAITGSDEGTQPVDAWLGAAAALLYALSYAAAFQAVRPEVYALSALLVLSTLLELARFDRSGDRRRLYAASVWAGLALMNHHLLALAAIGPAALIVLVRRPPSEKPLAAAIARVLLGGSLASALLAYLPLRAQRHPLVDWGAPDTLARVWWTVSARAFQKAVERGSTGDVPAVAAALTLQLAIVGALLALAGAYVIVRLRPLRRVGAMLLAGALADAAMPALVGFDVANPDAYGYLEVAVALLAIVAIVPVAALAARAAGRASPRALALACALVCGLALVPGARAFPEVTLARDHDAARALGRFLDGAPPRAPAVTSYFQTVFGLWYLRAAEGARPDVDLVHRHFLAYPGYRDELLRARPELTPLVGEREVNPLALPKDALVEYDLDLPEGLTGRARTVDTRGLELDEPQARRYAGWQAFLEVHRACRVGDRAGFDRALGRARSLFGDSPELNALAARCAP